MTAVFGFSSAVVPARRRPAVGARAREPRDRAAEAIADDADLLAALRQLLHRGLHVHHRLVEAQLAARRAPALDVLRSVARLVAALDAIEERRRHRDVAVGGEAVRQLPDVLVHAEDLLNHHAGAARRAG